MIYIIRRIYETLICNVIVSVIFSSLFYFGILQPGYSMSVLMLSVAAIIDLGLMIFFSSVYYKYTEEDTKTFYKTNTLALLTLVIPAIVLALLDAVVSLEPIYTFLFLPFKLGMIAIGMSKFCSALTFAGIIFVVLTVVPLFLQKVLPEEEIAPPMMVLESDENEEEKETSE